MPAMEDEEYSGVVPQKQPGAMPSPTLDRSGQVTQTESKGTSALTSPSGASKVFGPSQERSTDVRSSDLHQQFCLLGALQGPRRSQKVPCLAGH